MLKSGEYFLAGFFGLEWTNNATLEVIIEGDGYNNSLAGYDNCNNSNTAVAAGGTNASLIWENKYLANATARFQALSGNFKWNVSDTYKQVIQWVSIDDSNANKSAAVRKHFVLTRLLHSAIRRSVTSSPMRNGRASSIPSTLILQEITISKPQREELWVLAMFRRSSLVCKAMSSPRRLRKITLPSTTTPRLSH